MNVHSSTRSTITPSAGRLSTLRPPAIDASTLCRPKRDRVRDVRDGTSVLIRKLSAPAKGFHREKSAVRHVTTPRVNRHFHPPNDTRIPAEAGAYRFTGQVLHYYSHASGLPTNLWPPRPIAYHSARSTPYSRSRLSAYTKN